MSAWVKLLPIELDSITEFKEPENPVEDTDKVLGVASDFIKQLFTLLKLLGEDYMVLARKTQLTRNPETIRKLQVEMITNQRRGEAVSALLWIAVCDEFEVWGQGDVGIRSGYQVVLVPPPKPANQGPALYLPGY